MPRTPLVFLTAIACAPLDPSDGIDESVATTAHAIASDPSSHAPSGICVTSFTHGGVSGRIRHRPSGGVCSSMPFSPIVVVLRGQGFTNPQYDYLITHLGRNGFVAVSINYDTALTPPAVVAQVMGYLEGLRTQWTKGGFILADRAAVVGHSRGGEYARDVAVAMNAPGLAWQARAVVGLASREDGNFVNPGMADAVLLLHGAIDGQVLPDRSYRIYDKSGTEGSVALNGVDRSMKLFESGSHDDFVEEDGTIPEMAIVTRGYVLAFLAEHLQEDPTWYEDYIRSPNVPHVWTGTVASQFEDGVLVNVIDNAEDGNVTPSTMNASVDRQDVASANIDLAGVANSAHETRALRFQGTTSSSHVTWHIPAAHQNASGYDALSFRIGQTGGTPDFDLSVEIRNGNTWSGPVAITAAHGQIGQPLGMCTTVNNHDVCWAGDVDDLVNMTTVRIPLSAFGAFDDVERVRLHLGGALLRTYYVDSVAFSGWSAVP